MKSPDRDAADALLPCPFCGPGQSICDTWFDDLAQKWRVGCGRCGASSGTNQDKGAVIASWNCRPAASELATLCRRVAEMEQTLSKASEYLDRWRRGLRIDYDGCAFANELSNGERHGHDT